MYSQIHVALTNTNSSHRGWSVRKGVLRNFAKFTGKHLCQAFPSEFLEISKNIFFTEHIWTTVSEIQAGSAYAVAGNIVRYF